MQSQGLIQPPKAPQGQYFGKDRCLLPPPGCGWLPARCLDGCGTLSPQVPPTARAGARTGSSRSQTVPASAGQDTSPTRTRAAVKRTASPRWPRGGRGVRGESGEREERWERGERLPAAGPLCLPSTSGGCPRGLPPAQVG